MYFSLPSTLIEFIILSLLSDHNSYGYEIAQEIKRIHDIKEPVLYPVLKKLERLNWITSYQEIHNGRNRKYYAITQSGKNQQKLMLEDWKKYAGFIDEIARKQGKETV